MSDAKLPREFKPICASSPKKETDREKVERLRKEMESVDLASETVAQMEGLPDPIRMREEDEEYLHVNVTLLFTSLLYV